MPVISFLHCYCMCFEFFLRANPVYNKGCEIGFINPMRCGVKNELESTVVGRTRMFFLPLRKVLSYINISATVMVGR